MNGSVHRDHDTPHGSVTRKPYVAGATVDYVPDSMSVPTGTLVVGDVASLQVLDDADAIEVTEVNGVPGFNVLIDYADVVVTPTRLDLYCYYIGNPAHVVNVQIYDQVGLAWVTLGVIPDGVSLEYLTFDILAGAKYVDSNGAVETRLYHLTAGVPGHDLFVDYCLLRKIPVGAGTGVTDHGGLTGLGDDDHTDYHTNARGDARYLYRENAGAFTPDADYEPATKKYVDDNAGGASAMDDLSDADTTTDAPNLNEVLKWDGSNWVPGTAGDTSEFTFSIDSFSDGIGDTTQLIGGGASNPWAAVNTLDFTAAYSNAPGGMTAFVGMTGGANAPWVVEPKPLIPVTGGANNNDEEVDYPAAAGGTIVFTLTQSADGTSDTESVTFNNTMRYGTNALTQGNQTEGSCEALSEVAGPNESRSQTISNIAADAGKYLTFAYADRLADVAQVQRDSGWGYVTASFAAAATTLAPDVQAAIAAVDNSADYSEAFAAITSRLTDLTDGNDDFKLLTSSTAQNYLYWGELNIDSGADDAEVYTEANVEGNFATQPGKVASNSISSRSMTVNAGVAEYTYIAYPARLGALSSIIIGGFESIGDFWIDHGVGTELVITNAAGYQENYYVYVSKNPGFTDPTTMTVSL